MAVPVLDGLAGLVLLGFIERLRNWRFLAIQIEACWIPYPLGDPEIQLLALLLGFGVEGLDRVERKPRPLDERHEARVALVCAGVEALGEQARAVGEIGVSFLGIGLVAEALVASHAEVAAVHQFDCGPDRTRWGARTKLESDLDDPPRYAPPRRVDPYRG